MEILPLMTACVIARIVVGRLQRSLFSNLTPTSAQPLSGESPSAVKPRIGTFAELKTCGGRLGALEAIQVTACSPFDHKGRVKEMLRPQVHTAALIQY